MTQTLRVATLLFLAASPLFAQSGTAEYSIIELPRLPIQARDRHSYATGINDARQIVGLIYSDFNDDVAVLWDHGAPIRIGGFNDDSGFWFTNPTGLGGALDYPMYREANPGKT